MRNITLPIVRFDELAVIVDQIPPKDLANMKDIRLAASLVADIKASFKEQAEKVDNLRVRQAECAKPYQAEYKEKEESLDDEGKKALAQELDAKLSKELEEKFGEEVKALDEGSKVEVTVELGDEKHAKLCEWFEKYAVDKYKSKEVLVIVADALGVV